MRWVHEQGVARVPRVHVINMSQSAIVHSYDDMCGTNNQIHSVLNFHTFCEITYLVDVLVT